MRFVILLHQPPGHAPTHAHWDLFVDTGGPLRAWALQAEPGAGATVAAVALPGHRRVYMAYEGPITGERGTVSRVDSGECEIRGEIATKIEFCFHGQRLQGPVTCLVCATSRAESLPRLPHSLPPLPNSRA